MTEMIEPTTAQVDQQQLGRKLVERPMPWVELVGPGDLPTGLMKWVLRTTAGHKGTGASRTGVNGQKDPNWDPTARMPVIE